MHHLYVWCMEAEPKLHPPRHLWTRARCTRSLMARRASATCPATQTAFCRLDRLSLVARGTVVSSFYPFSLSLLSCSYTCLSASSFRQSFFSSLPASLSTRASHVSSYSSSSPSTCYPVSVLPRCSPSLSRPSLCVFE